MKVIENLHHALTKSMFSYDDFDLAILKYARSQLDEADQQALDSQMDLINKAQTTFDEESNKQLVMFYWMYLGKSRRDFPLAIKHMASTQPLMKLKVTVNEQTKITASVIMVKGVIFCIEYTSTSDSFRPLSPDFEISELPL